MRSCKFGEGRVLWHLVVSVLLTSLTAVLLPAPGEAETTGSYTPPVDAEVVDPYRPPPGPYGPGNRGIDYETAPGAEVHAARGGEVTFSGRIGPAWHVVVLHADGIRTSYSFLTSATMRRGDRVERGDVLGTAGGRFHFGARAGDRYLDPSALFSRGETFEVGLIPIEERSPRTEAKERRGLLAQLGHVVSDGLARVAGGTDEALSWLQNTTTDLAGHAWTLTEWVAALGWNYAYGELMRVGMQLRIAALYINQFGPGTAFYLMEQARRGWRFQESQENCTPSDRPVQRSRERRIMVMVNGLESNGGEGGLRGLEPTTMGYRRGDIIEFSYRGGRSDDPGTGSGTTVSDYGPNDTHGDLREQADRLRDLLMEIRATNPGVPVDVVAHSQGGIVSRLALGNDGDRFDARLPDVANLVMLGTPNHGSDAATANAFLETTTSGDVAQELLEFIPATPELDAVSVAQLSEGSAMMRELDEHPLPSGTRVTSIAAEGDLVVSPMNSSLEGATNVLLPVRGLHAHGDMLRSPEARREVALALAGMGPTCRSLGAGILLGSATSWATDALGVLVGAGSAYLDLQVGLAGMPRTGLPDLSDLLGAVVKARRRSILQSPCLPTCPPSPPVVRSLDRPFG